MNILFEIALLLHLRLQQIGIFVSVPIQIGNGSCRGRGAALKKAAIELEKKRKKN